MTDVQAILAALRPPVVLGGRCARCGDPLRDPEPHDYDCQVSPRGAMIPATSIGVCGTCLATAHDKTGRLSRAVKDGSGQTRDGWVDPSAADPDDRTGAAVRGSKPKPSGKRKPGKPPAFKPTLGGVQSAVS